MIGDGNLVQGDKLCRFLFLGVRRVLVVLLARNLVPQGEGVVHFAGSLRLISECLVLSTRLVHSW